VVRGALFQEGDVAQIGPCLLRLYLGKEGRALTYEPSEVVLLDTPTPVVETPRDHRFIDAFGSIIQVPQGSSIVGRGAGAQIRLDYDARVSAQHALLEAAPSILRLQPLDPVSPTCVNGEVLAGPVHLQDGDRITVGATTLQYRN
jgi:pSer/pThr/pTyr-binding forkhead associated (FHA) protein